MFPIRKRKDRPKVGSEDSGEQRRKVGRPMKRFKELAIPKRLVNARLRELYRQFDQSDPPSTAALSSLERLPNEVIQQIFFHCFEISLPRASRDIAHALSTESTYRVLILFAFFNDDGEHHVDTKVFLPATYVPLPSDQQTRIQRGILGCRWCTLDRISACLPILNRLAMIQAWCEEKEEEDFYDELAMRTHDSPFDRAASLTTLPDSIRQVALLPAYEDSDAMERHFFTQADYENPLDNEIRTLDSPLPRIITWALRDREIENDPNKDMSKYAYHRLSTLAARVLPEWLVRGNPWTEDKLRLLQLLRQGSRFVHQEVSLEVSTSSVIDGMSCAIREQNTEALMTLLELHRGVIRDKELPTDSDGVDDEDGSGWNVTKGTRRSHQLLPAHLFRLAAKADAKSSEMLTLLIRGSVESIPNEDVALTAWALDREAKGNKIAHWLLDHMAGTRDDGFSLRPQTPTGGSTMSTTVRGEVLSLVRRPLWHDLGYLIPCPFDVP